MLNQIIQFVTKSKFFAQTIKGIYSYAMIIANTM